MIKTLLSVIGLSFIGSILGFGGGLLLVWKESFSKKYSVHLISFAAGVILAITFLDILPEALASGGENTFLLALIGLVIFFLIEDFLLHLHHHEDEAHPVDATASLLIISDAVHNFIDGVVIAVSFLVSPKLGMMVAFATFLHEIPKETGDFAILLSRGFSKAKAIWANLLTALTSFLGATLTVLLAGKTTNLVGPMLGLAAGMFLYISASDLLPELVKGGKKDLRWHTTGFFLLGILMIYSLMKFIPE
jgi:zinc and cadmium transporter